MTTERRVDWRSVSLLGIDVGFSAKIKSTGIAAYSGGRLVTLTCVGSSPQNRTDVLPDGMIFDAVAIDGPIVPVIETFAVRECERTLSRGKFSGRCKPAMSHYGHGLPLRKAAMTIADEMVHRAKPPEAQFSLRQPYLGKAIVEAFPNSFLGVLLDDVDYDAMGKIERGRKSDVFYKRVADNKTFERLLAHLGWNDDALLTILHDNANAIGRAAHDKRAALVCLLTAACALSGKAEHVGDDAGGSICLPPKALWADWARDAINRAMADSRPA